MAQMKEFTCQMQQLPPIPPNSKAEGWVEASACQELTRQNCHKGIRLCVTL